MSEIRYVCMSDMHLGEQMSLLTGLGTSEQPNQWDEPSTVLKDLVACLRELITRCNEKKKPTLILMGDIFELALNTTNFAAMCFDRFLELIFPADGDALFAPTVYFVPGNHDHHLWEISREAQYVDYIKRHPGKEFLEKPWHVTNIFRSTKRPFPPSSMLNALAEKYNENGEIKFFTVYPNLGFVNDDKSRCVIFHHGHYVEKIYHLMSDLKVKLFPGKEPPDYIWNLEEENFAWIDFFWSALGRSGEVGRTVDSVYKRFLHGKGFVDFATDRIADYLKSALLEDPEEEGQPSAEGVIQKIKYWFSRMWSAIKKILVKYNILKPIIRLLVRFAMNQVSKREKLKTDKPLSRRSEKGLEEYLKGPLYRQMCDELSKGGEGGSQPSDMDVTFVFGHTHKPYQETTSLDSDFESLKIFNAGGWVVESVHPERKRGGAVVLLDKNLNATSLRMYNEAASVDEYNVRTAAPETISNPLHEKISEVVNAKEDPWRSFSTNVAGAIERRSEILEEYAARVDKK